MKAMLLRVGMDMGYGRFRAPIFNDGTFEFIPIPDDWSRKKLPSYLQLPARHSARLSDYLPERLHAERPHFDPEFRTFTYGDPTRNKRRQLMRLEAGDLLAFYAVLNPHDREDTPLLFVIGYFEVQSVYDFNSMTAAGRRAAAKKLRNNAHIKSSETREDLVVVAGTRNGSRLLEKAIPIGNARHYILPIVGTAIGYEKSILRAIGHWIEGHQAKLVRQWLQRGTAALLGKNVRLFSYVLQSDSGFAPNVHGGYCTLACCKPRIRAQARAGDWVMGTMPVRHGRDRLAYIMRVDECMTFDQYFRDVRFKAKKPSAANPDGDNIYYRKGGRIAQIKSEHHGRQDLKHDTKVDSVLIGSLYWYFGKDAPVIPRKLLNKLIKKGPGHRKVESASRIRKVISWVSRNNRPGVHGDPRGRG